MSNQPPRKKQRTTSNDESDRIVPTFSQTSPSEEGYPTTASQQPHTAVHAGSPPGRLPADHTVPPSEGATLPPKSDDTELSAAYQPDHGGQSDDAYTSNDEDDEYENPYEYARKAVEQFLGSKYGETVSGVVCSGCGESLRQTWSIDGAFSLESLLRAHWDWNAHRPHYNVHSESFLTRDECIELMLEVAEDGDSQFSFGSTAEPCELCIERDINAAMRERCCKTCGEPIKFRQCRTDDCNTGRKYTFSLEDFRFSVGEALQVTTGSKPNKEMALQILRMLADKKTPSPPSLAWNPVDINVFDVFNCNGPQRNSTNDADKGGFSVRLSEDVIARITLENDDCEHTLEAIFSITFRDNETTYI